MKLMHFILKPSILSAVGKEKSQIVRVDNETKT